jgi:hypothetical protein
MLKCAVLLVAICLADTAVAQEKVILDTDFTTIGDDGQVGIMAAECPRRSRPLNSLWASTVFFAFYWVRRATRLP